MSAVEKRKREIKPVPEGYKCAQCSSTAHWVYDCPDKKRKKKNKKNSEHVRVDGQDPSQADIDRAKAMQKEMDFINKTRPDCFCGVKSRLRKVKQTEDENSRAIGHFFFFCGKDKWDETKCKFARPAKEETVPLKKLCTFWAKGLCKKGEACEFAHNAEDRAITKDTKAAEKKEKEGEDKEAVKVEGEIEEKAVEKNDDEKADDDSSSSSSSESEEDDNLDDDDEQNF
jgi:hypothetical protein